MIAGVESVQLQVFLGTGAPEPQGVHRRATPADHRGVVGDGAYGLVGLPDLPAGAVVLRMGEDAAAEADAVGHLGSLELPGIAEIQPGLGLLGLPTLHYHLAEQPVLVADAVAVGSQAQGGHALHEAGRQAPQTAVAEGSVGLHFTDPFQVHVQFGQGLARHLQQVEVVQVIEQQAANEEFQRQVIDALFILPVDQGGGLLPTVDHMVASGQGHGLEPVVIEGVARVLAHRVLEFRQDAVLERLDGVGRARLLRHGRVSSGSGRSQALLRSAS
ncbi:hypothetical protein D9M71_428360 [compost metagenome]